MKNMLLIIVCSSSFIFTQSFSGPTYNPYNMTGAGSNSAPNFVDINNDGDYDCFTGIGNGFLAFYQKDETMVTDYPVIVAH